MAEDHTESVPGEVETDQEQSEQQEKTTAAEVAQGAEAQTEEDQLEQLKQQLAAQEQRSQENLDKALRAQAEMENLRKRTTRDVENAHKYALEKFLGELLPVLDSLELGINATEQADDIKSLREGMDLTLNKFSSVMEKFGVSVIDPTGEKFDPEQHEAISMQELDGSESGTVISVMQKGYALNGRLIRPAMVIVAK